MKIDTTIHGNSEIIQTVFVDEDVILRRVANVLEEQAKAALIKLGWKPPATTAEVRCDAAAQATLRTLGYTWAGGERWRPPLGPTRFTGPYEHRLENREDGLSHCMVCGGGEGSMPTLCPGRRLTSAETQDIYAGALDFNRSIMQGATWWRPAPIESDQAAEAYAVAYAHKAREPMPQAQNWNWSISQIATAWLAGRASK